MNLVNKFQFVEFSLPAYERCHIYISVTYIYVTYIFLQSEFYMSLCKTSWLNFFLFLCKSKDVSFVDQKKERDWHFESVILLPLLNRVHLSLPYHFIVSLLYQFSRWHSKMLRKYTDKLTWAQNSKIQIYQLSSNRNSIAGNYFFKLQIVTQFKKKPNDNTFLQADNVVTRHLYI